MRYERTLEFCGEPEALADHFRRHPPLGMKTVVVAPGTTSHQFRPGGNLTIRLTVRAREDIAGVVDGPGHGHLWPVLRG